MAVTPNYGWTIPTVGGSSGAWGTILNNAFIAIDAALASLAASIAGKLPYSGGTMTGNLNVLTSAMKRLDIGNVAGNYTFDLSLAQSFTLTIVSGANLAFANWPSGAFTSGVALHITNGGAGAVTWPAAMRWSNGAAPALTPAGHDRLVFISDDNGTTIHGMLVGQALA